MRQVKASSYMQLTCCLLGSSYLSTVGLDYINYPTKVVFRSCKLIPTMAVALVMNKERFSLTDITCAVAICVGLALFALADMTSVSKVSTVFGMALQASSTVADAFLPNLQQALFKQGASTLEVTYYTNLYVFIIMTLMGGGSGHIQGAWSFVRTNATNGIVLVFYSVVAYWAINFHIRVVQRYGSVVAVLVGNLRKAGTIALSFLVFPKPFSWFYVVGTLLVFGGLTITAYVKDLKRRWGSVLSLSCVCLLHLSASLSSVSSSMPFSSLLSSAGRAEISKRKKAGGPRTRLSNQLQVRGHSPYPATASTS